MKTVLILVEGQTEEHFIKRVLLDYLHEKKIHIIPVLIKTKEVKSGPNYKGGVNSYHQIKKDLQRLLRDSSVVVVTTMFDYYGLPRDFPDHSSTGDCYQKVKVAEDSFATEIHNQKFIPYLQLHEFESILFTSPTSIANTMNTSEKTMKKLQTIRNSVTSPEEIDEGEETHPSRRLEKLFLNYNKPLHGTLISTRIGIQQIIDNCPHFKQWVEHLIEKVGV